MRLLDDYISQRITKNEQRIRKDNERQMLQKDNDRIFSFGQSPQTMHAFFIGHCIGCRLPWPWSSIHHTSPGVVTRLIVPRNVEQTREWNRRPSEGPLNQNNILVDY